MTDLPLASVVQRMKYAARQAYPSSVHTAQESEFRFAGLEMGLQVRGKYRGDPNRPSQRHGPEQLTIDNLPELGTHDNVHCRIMTESWHMGMEAQRIVSPHAFLAPGSIERAVGLAQTNRTTVPSIA